ANLWLSKWSTDTLAGNSTSVRDNYLVVYATVTIGTLNASMKIHGKLLSNVLRAPLSFFDTNLWDIDVADTTLPFNVRMIVTQTLSVLGTLVIISIALPWFVAVIVPIRIESISRSPIYSHFGETLTGMSTIRAFGRVKIDHNAKCYFPTFISSRWLAVRLETFGNLLVLFAALFSVTSKGSIDPGMVGLSLSYSLSITSILNMLVRVSTDVETNMVSVERINEYESIPQEAPYDLPDSDPSPQWPQHGVIKFDNYKTRYRKGLDLVLKGISCWNRWANRGREVLTHTGFEDPFTSTEKTLDSWDWESFVHDLPSYHKTQMNLDPFQTHSDREIWTALEQAHLKTFVSNLADGLHFTVLRVKQSERGAATAHLHRSINWDEATAAIDCETDDLIQSTIRREFQEVPVVTMAHRINTIMDSNRIMVLDSGTIAEFDSPQKLLENRIPIFMPWSTAVMGKIVDKL
ncbi:Uncharacterized protein FKW44_016589, partial [Caligus rogercresseyi]